MTESLCEDKKTSSRWVMLCPIQCINLDHYEEIIIVKNGSEYEVRAYRPGAESYNNLGSYESEREAMGYLDELMDRFF